MSHARLAAEGVGRAAVLSDRPRRGKSFCRHPDFCSTSPSRRLSQPPVRRLCEMRIGGMREGKCARRGR